MKNAILTKHHPSVQLAHLYEHLFVMRVNELLNQRGLFKWIDYTLNGTTYEQGGVITIDFRAYNDDAEAFLAEMMDIRLQFDESQITKALMQLHAEEYYEFNQASRESIVKSLKDIDEMQWQSLDELTVLDTKDLKRKNTPLHLTNVEARRPITTKVSLEFSEQYADADPLVKAMFNVVARAILMTATYNIAKNTGSYSYQMYTQLARRRVSVDIFTADIFRTQTPEFTEAIEEVKTTVYSMNQHGAFERLVKELQSTSYYENGAKAPDYEQLMNDAGILIGSKGWSLVNQELVESIFSNVYIDIRRSRKSARVPLVNF